MLPFHHRNNHSSHLVLNKAAVSDRKNTLIHWYSLIDIYWLVFWGASPVVPGSLHACPRAALVWSQYFTDRDKRRVLASAEADSCFFFIVLWEGSSSPDISAFKKERQNIPTLSKKNNTNSIGSNCTKLQLGAVPPASVWPSETIYIWGCFFSFQHFNIWDFVTSCFRIYYESHEF